MLELWFKTIGKTIFNTKHYFVYDLLKIGTYWNMVWTEISMPFNGWFCYRPLGATIKTYIEQVSVGISGIRRNREASPEFEQLNSAIEEARWALMFLISKALIFHFRNILPVPFHHFNIWINKVGWVDLVK